MAADPGASHAKKGRPSPETRSLLARSHATLRDELADVLTELRPPVPPPGPPAFGEPPPPGRPSLADRQKLVTLIGQLMTLLGTEIVESSTDGAAPAIRKGRSSRRVDYG